MAIALKKEPDDFSSNFWGIIEKCIFCNIPTKYWHMYTNNPVCPDCAKDHKVSELPDHGKMIRAAKKKLKTI